MVCSTVVSIASACVLFYGWLHPCQDQGDGDVAPHGPDPGVPRIQALVVPKGFVKTREILKYHRWLKGIPDRPKKAKKSSKTKSTKTKGESKPVSKELGKGKGKKGSSSKVKASKRTGSAKAKIEKAEKVKAKSLQKEKDCWIIERVWDTKRDQ